MESPSDYLARLTIRLATGVEALGEAFRARQLQYLLACQRADGGFAGREGESDLYYTSFALRALAVLGGLEGSPAIRASAFITSRLTSQVGVVDLVSLIYARALLQNAAGVDPFSALPNGWLGSLDQVFESFRREDGGYAKTADGFQSSTYYSFLVTICRAMLGLTFPRPDALAAFAASRQREDGGFVEMASMKRSGTNPTAAGIGLFRALDRLPPQTAQQTINFLAEMQTDEGGLRANSRIPVADILSTFTGLWTLADLNALGEMDLPACRAFAELNALPEGGFRASPWDPGYDVEYTFYGIGTLALLTEVG